MTMALTYKKSGVDIAKGDRLVDIIKPMARSTFRKEVAADIGSFGAFFKLDIGKYKDPILVSGTDGVGTKLKIAFLMDRHNTVGIDLVAMSVNDVLTSGAEPLFFLDYFATGSLSTKTASEVIRGIADGCKMSGCSLIGGETAEMPGFYKEGEYDLAGFAVGIVDRAKVISGSRIKKGDAIIGLASSGLHSNGYSLARKLFFDIKRYRADRFIKELDSTIGDALLKPTRIYVKSILKILRAFDVKGLAHITGGGITGNLPRIFPKNLKAAIKKESWPVPAIFDLIEGLGEISTAEMFRTFNMGIGFMIVVSDADAAKVIKRLNLLGEKAFLVGQVEKGRSGVTFI